MYRLVFWMILLVYRVKAKAHTELEDGLFYSYQERNLSYVPAIHPKTRQLDLSFNYFPFLHWRLFPQLFHLQELDLTRCQIKYIGNDAFQNVRSITTLVITGNPIDGLSTNAFTSLTGLQRLVLANTGLHSIEDIHLCHLTKVQELNVGTNHLTNMSIPGCFSNFTQFRKLDLHANKISVIRKDHTAVLKHMKNNITLILSRNPIMSIEIGAFQNIYLQDLQLREAFTNPVETDNLKAMVGLTVEKLEIGRYRECSRRLKVSNYSFLDGLCLINFREIYFYQRERAVGPVSEFHCMANATKITLLKAEQSLVDNLHVLKAKELSLIESRINYFPAQIYGLKTLERLIITDNAYVLSFNIKLENMPCLKYIDLSNNKMTVPFFSTAYEKIPKVQFLNLSRNNAVHIDIMGIGNLSNLEVLDFHHTKLISIGRYTTMSELNGLKYLDVSYTSTMFTNPQSLMGLFSLRVLKMSGNNFHKDVLQDLFMNLTLLETLDISFCGIEHLHSDSFRNVRKLTHLFLSGNKLMGLEFLKVPELLSLTEIDLARNHISFIPKNILQNLPKNLKIFDISLNPIDCSCSNVDFIDWILNHECVVKYLLDTNCWISVTVTQTRVLEFDIMDCKHIFTAKVTSAIFVVVFLLIMSALAYKFHFYLRYCCVLLKGYEASAQQEVLYDAFVIYSSLDEAWVMEELVENLERGVPPFRLCFHVRDFEVGRSITSNITESIMGSRKVIVVVSRHFTDSSWCHFEFEMAQSWQLLEGKLTIIIIILEDVEEDRTRKVFGLHKHIRRNTYLKWNENPISTVRFWSRLRRAIMSK